MHRFSTAGSPPFSSFPRSLVPSPGRARVLGRLVVDSGGARSGRLAGLGIVAPVSDSDFDDLNASLSSFGSSGRDDADDVGHDDSDLDDLRDLDDEERDQVAAAQQAMEEARARLADVPAEVVVTNHVMGLYELAAIHLSSEQPDLAQAALAIDAVACLVDGLGDRLGPDASTMKDALNNIRLAFVQIKGS